MAKRLPNMAKIKTFLETPIFPAKTARYAKDAMGVELEHEFDGPIPLDEMQWEMNKTIGVNAWNAVADGSLRGNGLEFISKPLAPDNLIDHIQTLYATFDKYGVKPLVSHRTSTHVHLNFSKNTIKEVYQFLLLYYFLEPTLFCLTEEDRWHNTFCVSSETVPSTIANHCDAYVPFWQAYEAENNAKYASLNLAPYTKLGTLESRIYHGAYDVKDLCNWVTVLKEIKAFALAFDSIKSLYKVVEQTDFQVLLKRIFVTTFPFVAEHIAMREKKLYELANLGNSIAFPLLSVEKRLAEATAFFTEEQERIAQMRKENLENEKQIESYMGIMWNEEPV